MQGITVFSLITEIFSYGFKSQIYFMAPYHEKRALKNTTFSDAASYCRVLLSSSVCTGANAKLLYYCR